jgi:hypothetical protein
MKSSTAISGGASTNISKSNHSSNRFAVLSLSPLSVIRSPGCLGLIISKRAIKNLAAHSLPGAGERDAE